MNLIHEILSSLKQNKLRTTLTGLSVSWGIFILIILLGAANGLKNAVFENFKDRAKNTVSVTAWSTSKPYKGRNENRNLSFLDKNLQTINELSETQKISAIFSKELSISYKKESGNFYTVKGIQSTYNDIFSQKIKKGRLINEMDLKYRNKVIVLQEKIAKSLFNEQSGVGEYISVAGILFKVIGVVESSQTWKKEAYIPFTTAQAIYNPNKRFNQFVTMTQGLDNEEENESYNQQIQQRMSKELEFEPSDQNALWIDNIQETYLQTMKIFGGLNLFIMLIGILTLIAGVVGVSNIMLVSVRERTREIGIRKAIGATPSSILKDIVVESVLITAIFGYIGMLLGIGLIELVGFVMEQGTTVQLSSDGFQLSVFKSPTLELKYILISTLILILSGGIAGYIPAKRAVKIQPIEAMREQ